jgi:hypothetical protein
MKKEAEEKLVATPVPYRRTLARKLFVLTGNLVMIAYFIVLSAWGLEYITPFAFGACVLLMCYISVILMFFVKGYMMFIAPVRELCAGVLTNLFFGRKAPKTDVESLSLDSIPSIEEVGWGVWNWKFPWQSVTYVDLKRHIPVGGTEGIGYTKDQVETPFMWKGSVRVPQGYCGTLVRIGDEAAIRMAEALTDAAVAEMINKVKYKQLPSKQTHLAYSLREYYEGDGNMSAREAGIGLAIEKLVLKYAKRSKRVQDAAELEVQADSVNASAERLMLLDQDTPPERRMTGKEAVDRVLTLAGQGNLRVYEGLKGAEPLIELEDGPRNKKGGKD